MEGPRSSGRGDPRAERQGRPFGATAGSRAERRTAMTERAPRNQASRRETWRGDPSPRFLASLAPWRFFCGSGATSRSGARRSS
ncbi:uncharacterized protein SOCEGT47_006140 [Sorangium cellulosum]|uniref:Uncharacterized protein n=1 Tax=Sorangium cellulosum TaxID=56 RepID=A0A4P2PUA6_SORCE|nr:uncharacterized protein SOCEGT47_006140 [Sorangium cellulosum]